MITEIIEQGKRKLAMSLGVGAASRSLTKITSLLKGSAGWLVHGSGADEWRFEGFVEENGALYLYGPYFPGKTLGSILDAAAADALPFMGLLASALLLLKDRGILPVPLQTDSVLFTEDGGVLFFPPEVMQEVRGIRTFQENRKTFEAFNHPDLKGEALASFGIAALLYRITTGKPPFDGSSSEEIHEETRRREIPAPDRLVPGLSARLSDTVMECLSGGRRGSVKLSRWRECIELWRTQALIRELSTEEKERIRRESQADGKRLERRFRRKVFWERNKTLIAVAAALVAVAGIFVGSILKNILAPHATRGFSPRQVVETFYMSMNSLDHVMMSACVTGKAGKDEINEATNLFVISRVNEAWGGRAAVIAAITWDRNGRPKMDPAKKVYGVTGLSITEERGEPDPRFLVNYQKWIPIPPKDDAVPSSAPPAGPSFEGKTVMDRVSLQRERDYWVIYRIDRLWADPIDLAQ